MTAMAAHAPGLRRAMGAAEGGEGETGTLDGEAVTGADVERSREESNLRHPL
jgi:hypothetical protein